VHGIAQALETLLADLELPVVSLEDVYGGKLAAVLDRKHPCNLFDVMQFFAYEGITAGIRRVRGFTPSATIVPFTKSNSLRGTIFARIASAPLKV
jgi:hypothetical protein